MNKQEHLRTNVVVVGGGIAGLMTADHIARKGYAVTLVEKAPELASGATTKNEGWLHAGTYHSLAIENKKQAMQVAERTIYGHDYIMHYAPEAVEDPSAKTYALFESHKLAEIANERWEDAQVKRRELALHNLQKRIPQIDTAPAIAAFEVADQSINSRTLCQKLVRDIRSRGGEIFTKSILTPIDEHTAELQTAGNERKRLSADLFVVTAGTGIKDFFEKQTGEEFPMRFWKSHLLVMPRLLQDSVFYVDEGEAGIMNHGRNSVIGINRDGIQLPQPDLTVMPEKELLIFEAVNRLVPSTRQQKDKYLAVACIKADVFEQVNEPMSLNVTMGEPLPNYFYAVPGKMTESPFLAKEVTKVVEERITPEKKFHHVPFTNSPEVTLRPCDVFVASHVQMKQS